MATQNDEKLKVGPSKVGVIGIIVVVLILVIFVVCLSLGSAKTPDPIRDSGQLKSALADKTHINCGISHPDDGSLLLQANDGFSKVKVILYGDDGTSENMLTLDDKTYYWDDDGYAFVMSDRESMDGILEELLTGIEDDGVSGDYAVSCESPSNSDFAIPSLNFIDVSE